MKYPSKFLWWFRLVKLPETSNYFQVTWNYFVNVYTYLKIVAWFKQVRIILPTWTCNFAWNILLSFYDVSDWSSYLNQATTFKLLETILLTCTVAWIKQLFSSKLKSFCQCEPVILSEISFQVFMMIQIGQVPSIKQLFSSNLKLFY